MRSAMRWTKRVALPESDSGTGRSQGELPTVEQVIARVQRLCDTARPAGGYPLATYVEGWLLGDITAIATAAIRSEAMAKR